MLIFYYINKVMYYYENIFEYNMHIRYILFEFFSNNLFFSIGDNKVKQLKIYIS